MLGQASERLTPCPRHGVGISWSWGPCLPHPLAWFLLVLRVTSSPLRPWSFLTLEVMASFSATIPYP